MPQDLLDVSLCAQTLLGVLVQDFQDEILSLGGDFDLLRKLDLAFLDELEHETLRLVVEGRQTVHHLIDEDTQ